MRLHVIRLADSHGWEHTFMFLFEAEEDEPPDDLPPGVEFELCDHAEREGRVA